MRLDGKTVVCTGGASGIGRATAIRCASEGATVVVADIDETGGRETVAEVEAEGADAYFRRVDVSDGAAFQAHLEDVADEHGLDGLFNNAGVGHPRRYLEDTTEESFDRVIDVNVRGVWNGCRAAVPIMKDQGHGAIVNMSSLGGYIGLRKQSIYSLSKGAVLNFTRAVAGEVGPFGVRANAVCPGFVDVGVGSEYFEAGDDPDSEKDQVAKQYPLRRLGQPEEVAACVTFLLSEDASYVTGHGLLVDGGYYSV